MAVSDAEKLAALNQRLEECMAELERVQGERDTLAAMLGAQAAQRLREQVRRYVAAQRSVE